jgi:hypothetical protein
MLRIIRLGALVLLVALAFNATTSYAITMLDFTTSGVGWYDRASKANKPTDVTEAAKLLVGYYNKPSVVPTFLNVSFTLAPTDFDVLPGGLTYAYKNEAGKSGSAAAIDASSYEYVLGKYGNYAYLFYIGDLNGLVQLPRNLGGHDLSHQVAFDAERINVPDGGITVALLGLAIAGLELARRRWIAVKQ